MFKNPPPPRKFEIGEYNAQYVPKHLDRSIYLPPKLASEVFCRVIISITFYNIFLMIQAFRFLPREEKNSRGLK